MTVRHEFSNLMNLISKHLVPVYVAEHVFANKDKIADAMQATGTYSFKTPTGETIEVRIDNV
jgi:hypothetical protein